MTLGGYKGFNALFDADKRLAIVDFSGLDYSRLKIYCNLIIDARELEGIVVLGKSKKR